MVWIQRMNVKTINFFASNWSKGNLSIVDPEEKPSFHVPKCDRLLIIN